MDQPENAEQRREAYLAKACDAEERAASMRDVETRRVLLQIAESWRLLAEKIRDYPV